jgi:glycerol kinase
MGAAMLAGLATGVWKSMDELRATVKGADVFKPKMQAAERERLLAGWHDAVSRTLTKRAN